METWKWGTDQLNTRNTDAKVENDLFAKIRATTV